MLKWVERMLRVIISISLVASVVVQTVFVPLLWRDMDETRLEIKVALVAIWVLFVVALQVVAACVWRLLTMVRRDTVFSPAAFKFVDLMIGAVAVGSGLTACLAMVGAYSNRTTPGDEIAPGLVALILVIALVIAGVAVLLVVMRALLSQAMVLQTTTKTLQSELDEVI